MINYEYKGTTFQIKVCVGKDWREKEGLFYVENSQPYGFEFTKSLSCMKEDIEKKFNEYHDKIPKTKDDWIELFGSCVISDGYEEWHIDDRLAFNVLELYKKHS